MESVSASYRLKSSQATFFDTARKSNEVSDKSMEVKQSTAQERLLKAQTYSDEQTSSVATRGALNPLTEVVNRLNQQVARFDTSLKFEQDTESGEPVLLIKNVQTEEVIRQIPSEMTLKITKQISDFLSSAYSNPADKSIPNSLLLGLFTDKQA
ncbi:MAG: flagellar protein FlaG [Thiomicrospira sp.]|jgi:flagellar protein FlaG|nr:flagellar protein FlaG [Thiomicrospira sp.]